MVLCLHYGKSSNSLRFRPVKPKKNEITEIVSLGADTVVARVSDFAKTLVINPTVIAVGGTGAMAALSIRNNIMSFASVPGSGISEGLNITAELAYHLRSRTELIDSGRQAHRYTIAFELIPGILIALLSVPLSLLFLPQGSYEERSLLVFALCMGALKLVFETLLTARISFLEAIHHFRESRRLMFAFNFAIVSACVMVMGHFLGAYGVMAALTVSDLLVMQLIYLLCAFDKKRMRLKAEDYLYVTDECDVFPGDIIELDIRDPEDSVLTAEQVQMFCRGHKADPKQGFYAGLLTEEASMMILEIIGRAAGPRRPGEDTIKFHMTYSDGRVRMQFRFSCRGVSLSREMERIITTGSKRDPETTRETILRSFSGEIKSFRAMDIENLVIIV